VWWRVPTDTTTTHLVVVGSAADHEAFEAYVA
jgi:hypothetical protein